MKELSNLQMEVEENNVVDLPTRQLMLAILFDAVQAYLNSVGRSFNDARNWIFKNDENYIFSYVGVCVELGIDPGYLREGISRRVGNSKRLSRRF